MSQAKVDKRKKSNGEALHNANKKIKMLTWILVFFTVLIIGFSVLFNKVGYNKGHGDGYNSGYADGYISGYQKARETTKDDSTKEDSTKEDSTKEDSTKEDSTKADNKEAETTSKE